MTQLTKLMPENEALISNVSIGRADIVTLNGWLLTNPKDYVIVSKDRMHVLRDEGGFAKVGIYPALPTIIYNKLVAQTIAGAFHATNGENIAIEWEVVRIDIFAPAAIKDLTARIADIRELL